MVHKYLSHNKPEFVHVDEERLHELLATAEAGGRGREIEEEAVQQGKNINLNYLILSLFRGISRTN